MYFSLKVHFGQSVIALVIISSFLWTAGNDFLRAQEVRLEVFSQGHTQPVGIYHYDSSGYYVVERRGRIVSVTPDGSVISDPPFLDIRSRVDASSGEMGLLGMAFHPNFPDSPYIYVNYTGLDADSYISRFSVEAGSTPLVLDPDSEQILLHVEQPFRNHNGGCVRFGPDGYLYIGLGDGGAAGDPGDNAQDRLTFLGKLLRIDVDGGDPYSIPPDNPFAEDDFTLDEIWALGLRNPWRFSFDPLTGNLWIGDVGQSSWEEIDYQSASSEGGENYGWRCYEGTHEFNQSGNCNGPFTFPVYEYPNAAGSGCSVTGGRVYRGNELSGLYGKYVFTDYCRGMIQYLDTNMTGEYLARDLIQGPGNSLVSFAETREGELFVLSIGEGLVYRIEPACSDVDIGFEVRDEFCPDAHDGRIELIVGGPDTIQSVQWSTGESGTLIDSLPSGTYGATVTDEAGCTSTHSISVGRIIDGPPLLPQSVEECGDSITIDLRQQIPAGAQVDWFREGVLYATGDDGMITLPGGSYRVRFAAPCETALSNTLELIVHPYPDTPEIMQDGNFLYIQSSYDSLQWYYEGVAIPGANGDTLQLSGAGAYFVEVFNTFGCSAQSEEVELTAVDHPKEEQLFVIHPNPGSFKQELRISWKDDVADGRLEIWRSDGRRQYRRNLHTTRGLNIEVGNWPSGLYIILWMKDGNLLGSRLWILSN